LTRAHDDAIIIAAEEEEHVTDKISKQAESPVRTKNKTTHELNRGFVLYLYGLMYLSHAVEKRDSITEPLFDIGM